jgi:tetratricopeptide (TPR) repeat protein
MKKLFVICVIFIALFSIGWVIHLLVESRSESETFNESNLVVEGNKLLNIGRYEEAKPLFLEAIKDGLKEEHKNLQAEWGLKKIEANEATSLDNFKVAIDALHQIDPNDAQVNLFFGEFYVENHEFDTAKSYFEKAIEKNSQLAEAHYELAQLYDQQGNIDASKSEFSLAIDISPTAKYRNELGHEYIKQKHLDAATAEYEKITEYPASALDVAEIYWQRDRIDLALIRQLQAIRWLEDKKIMERPENQDPWIFIISPEQTITLTRLEEKKAYAYLSVAFTLHLLENTEESQKYIKEMRDLRVARQWDINAIMSAHLDVLLLERFGLNTQATAFKTLYFTPQPL